MNLWGDVDDDVAEDEGISVSGDFLMLLAFVTVFAFASAFLIWTTLVGR